MKSRRPSRTPAVPPPAPRPRERLCPRATGGRPGAGLLSLLLCLVALLARAQTPPVDAFNPELDGPAYALAVLPDGKILLGGSFTTVAGQPRSRLARLHPDGTLDASFTLGANDRVNALTVQADGKILLGGNFSSVGGQARSYLARLHADGTLDPSFNPVVGGGFLAAYVQTIAVQADGRLLIGGYFTTVSGQARGSLARLLPNGTLDPDFNHLVEGTVYALALQPDGALVLGGGFTKVSGQTRNNLARLQANGTLDGQFTPAANAPVLAMAIQPEGKILLGGRFSTLAGQPRNYLGRLWADGTLDDAFDPDADARVYSLALQMDGRVLVAGSFSIIGGEPRNFLARLESSGAVDTTFTTGADDVVYALALPADGQVMVGGLFSTLGGLPRGGLGRLQNTAPVSQSLAYNGTTATWLRSGPGPEITRADFEHSPNGVTWTSLGAGTRIPGGWQLTGLGELPNGTLRARGAVAGGQYNGSGWWTESSLVIQQAVPFQILAQAPSFGVQNGHFGFEVSGEPGWVVVVESSPDFQTWTPLQTNTLGTGPLYFSDPTPVQAPPRFYRGRH